MRAAFVHQVADGREARPALADVQHGGKGIARELFALFFGVVDPDRDAIVVTSSGTRQALAGTQAGALKVTAYAQYPSKGRATGGVRAHRFLRGEDLLVSLSVWHLLQAFGMPNCFVSSGSGMVKP